VLQGTDARLKAQLMTGGIAIGNPVFSSDSATFENIMDLVTVDILYGHALIPSSFVASFKQNGCADIHPPPSCNALQSKLVELAGTCYGGHGYNGNECGDNLCACLLAAAP